MGNFCEGAGNFVGGPPPEEIVKEVTPDEQNQFDKKLEKTMEKLGRQKKSLNVEYKKIKVSKKGAGSTWKTIYMQEGE